MVLKTSENIKSIYRFIEFVSKLSGGGLPHERYKLIVFDEYKALSKEEIEVKRFSDAYLYLLNNINQSFCKEIIEISYYLLTNKHLDEKVINQILETYYLDYNETPHYLASLLHLKVLELIEYKNIEFAFMMSNLVMLKKGRYQLVPITHVFDRYNAFLKDRTIDKLVLIFAAAEAVIKNEQQTVKEQQEIIDIIIKNKDLLKKQYRIKKLSNKISKLLEKNESNTIVLSEYLSKTKLLKNYLYTENINILDGRYLFKCLIYKTIEYIFKVRNKTMQFRGNFIIS